MEHISEWAREEGTRIKVQINYSEKQLRDLCFRHFETDLNRCKSRKREEVFCKHITMYLIRHFFPKTSYGTIAALVGLGTHCSTIHGIKTVDNQMEIEKRLANKKYTSTWETLLATLKEGVKQKEMETLKVLYQYKYGNPKQLSLQFEEEQQLKLAFSE